jgi:pyridine nucleotide-disulfide oxidoreductase family protein
VNSRYPSMLKHLVLLGAGHAHLFVLKSLAQHHPADLNVTLVTPYTRQLYSGMVPGFVAGHYSLDDCVIPLEPLAALSRVKLVQGAADGIDTASKLVHLATGETMHYDVLSIDTGAVLDPERIEAMIPGARENGLFVRPIEAFGALWPQVEQLAQGHALSVAVLGGGAAGVELCLAAAHRLPHCRMTLVTGGPEPAAMYPAGVRSRLRRVLKKRNITVLQEPCVRIRPGELELASGARLACDAPILALGAQAAPWLAGSSLALDAQGFVLVNAFQQSVSHPDVFAAGDAASREDMPHPKSGVYAVRAGPALARNVMAMIEGQALHAHAPPARTLNLLSCGGFEAIAAWGSWHAQGRWVWHWKDRIDRGFITRFRPQAGV